MATSVYTGGPSGYNLSTSVGAGSRYDTDDILGFAREMSRRSMGPAQGGGGGGFGARTARRSAPLPPQRTYRMHGTGDPNEQLRQRAEANELSAVATPWQSWQGAARGARGPMVGFNSSGGYGAVDQQYLPPNMRAQQAGMIPPASEVPTGSLSWTDLLKDMEMRKRAGSGGLPVSFNAAGAF